MTFLLVIPLFLKVCNSCTRTLVYCSRRKISVARMLGINLLMSVKLETRFFQRIMVFIRFSFLTIRSPDFSKLMRPRPGVIERWGGDCDGGESEIWKSTGVGSNQDQGSRSDSVSHREMRSNFEFEWCECERGKMKLPTYLRACM